jgi:hypothetical protein
VLFRSLFTIVLVSIVPGVLPACPSCYGAADSPMTAGMNTAILVMLGIIGFVLGVIVSAFLFLWRRAKRVQAEFSDSTYVDEQGHLKSKNEKGVVEWNNF